MDDKDIAKLMNQASPRYLRLSALETEINEFKAEQEAAFQEKMGQRVEEVNRLKKELAELLESVNRLVSDKTLVEDRRQFFDKRITSQIRTRAGDYDKDALYEWAGKHSALLSNPVDLMELLQRASNAEDEEAITAVMTIISWAKQKHPELIVDEKAAVKMAIETKADGSRKYTDAPVELEKFVTNTSLDRFYKIVATYAIEQGIAALPELKPGDTLAERINQQLADTPPAEPKKPKAKAKEVKPDGSKPTSRRKRLVI